MKFIAVTAIVAFLAFASANERPSSSELREMTYKTDSEEFTWFDDGSITSEMIQEMLASKTLAKPDVPEHERGMFWFC